MLALLCFGFMEGVEIGRAGGVLLAISEGLSFNSTVVFDDGAVAVGVRSAYVAFSSFLWGGVTCSYSLVLDSKFSGHR